MTRQFAWTLAGFVAVSLGVTGLSRAAVQLKADVCQIRMKHWTLREKDGRVGLVATRPGKSPKWSVSAPTVQDPAGRFLASDPKGLQPTVELVAEKGMNTIWSFDILARVEPVLEDAGGHQMKKVGPSGFQFKMKMAAGPFKDWYLAAGDLPEGQDDRVGHEDALHPLKLVKEPKAAAIFTYVETEFSIGHN